jgi:hypothetical protein
MSSLLGSESTSGTIPLRREEEEREHVYDMGGKREEGKGERRLENARHNTAQERTFVVIIKLEVRESITSVRRNGVH